MVTLCSNTAATMQGVRIEARSGLGNVLVATKSFSPGETVVSEQPLLHVPQLKPSNPLYKPLQTYFEEHGIPASVVLKIIAGLTADEATQAHVLQCFCPDPTAFADTPVVKQAQLFAELLLKHPPVPEFPDWLQQAAQRTQQQQQQPAGEQPAVQQQQQPGQQQQQAEPQASCFALLVKLWLIWVTNGHSFTVNRSPGSALFQYGSKLTHTCSCPNTAYRTAAGGTAPVHALGAGVTGASSSSSSSSSQLPPAAVPARVPTGGGGSGGATGGGAGTAGTGAAGYHVALDGISEGDILTTNYLGLGHKRLLSTPMRQKLLRDKFLFKCHCHRCSEEVDLARGIPCPSCSGAFRAADKLLTAELALPEMESVAKQQQEQQQEQEEHVAETGQESAAAPPPPAATEATEPACSSRSASVPAASSNSGTAASAAASAAACGFVYCDMWQLLSGAAEPWRCDKCDSVFSDDTAMLWGRYYARSHAHIESDMEAWVLRLDDSLDSAPLIREPSALHDRVLGIVRLLGPRHWASWRLLLLGVELHCGVLEQAALQHKVAPTQPLATASTAPAANSGDSSSSSTLSQQQQQQQLLQEPSAASATAARVSVWVVRYCQQLWRHISHCYGVVEGGQLLGYHFTEAAQVLLQVASCPGLLQPSQAEALLDQALELQGRVLPGLRSLMGEDYHPLQSLVAGAAASASAAAAAAAAETAAAAAAAATGDANAATRAGETAGAVTAGQGAPPGGAGGSGSSSGRYVAASVKRYLQQQAAEAARVQQLVAELKQLEAQEGP